MSGRQTGFIIAVISLASIGIHLLFYNTLDFHRDELLYFSLGTHPAAGYASVPPVTGLLAWVMIKLMGFSLLAAKILPAVAGGLIIIITDAITREMKGGPFARILVALVMALMPLTLRMYFFFMPVPFEVLEWTLMLYLVARYINTKSNTILILLGIVTGIALLTKYLVGLLIIALIIVIPFTKHRRIFREKTIYIAAGIALLIFLPNLVWQVMHGLPVIPHMRALSETQFVHVNRITFLTDIMMFTGTGILLIIPGLLYLLTTSKHKNFRLLAWTSIVVIGILVLLRGKSYYSAGVLPVLVVAGGIIYERWLHASWLRAIFIIIILVPDILLIPAGIPVWKGPGLAKYFRVASNIVGTPVGLRDEDGQIHALPQDYADMIGWTELTKVTAKVYRAVPDKKSTVIYAENYGEAGAINVIGKKYGLPQPLCFAESFNYWNHRTFPVEIKTVLYVNYDKPGKDIYDLFGSVIRKGGITDTLSREYGTSVYLCTDPRYSFNAAWKQACERETNPFR